MTGSMSQPADKRERRRLLVRKRKCAVRLACIDFSVPMQGAEKSARMDLGLTLLSSRALPGVRYSYEEIAAWAGCTPTSIELIEQQALRKLRILLQFRRPDILSAFRLEFFDRRTAAAPVIDRRFIEAAA
jgi:hypothetical protein